MVSSLRLRDRDSGVVIAVDRPHSVLGRDSTADIAIAGERERVVSLRHAEIRAVEDGTWVIADLGSTNGTFVNATRVTEPQVLSDGDIVGLAPNGPTYQVMLARPAPTILDRGASPDAVTRLMSDAAGGTVLDAGAPPFEELEGRRRSVVLRRVKGKAVLRVATAGTVVLGRDSDCDLALRTKDDRTVSGRHAEIRFTAEGVALLADLGSRNGTWLGKSRIERATPIRPGDRIALGQRGPVFEVLQLAEGELAEPVVPRRAARQSLSEIIAGARVAAKGGGTSVLAAALAEQFAVRATRKLRAVAIASAAVVVVVVGLVYFISSSRVAAAKRQAEEARMQLAEQLDRAFRDRAQTEAEVRRLSQQLTAARQTGGSRALTDSLTRRLQGARELSTTLQVGMAAVRTLELATISRMNSPALVGVMYRGSTSAGVVITSDGYVLTSGLVVGVAADSGGADSVRVYLRGAESREALTAEVISVSGGPRARLAVLRVRGYSGPSLPRVNWYASTTRLQLPVAAIGLRAIGSGDSLSPVRWRPVTATGTILSIDSTGLVVQVFATPPPAGAPIFDGSGALIGLNVGTLREGPVRMEMAPLTEVARLLPQELKARFALVR
jgi:pSer/pThr/pTyr-binding forkhead associated (FHA) protein